MSNQKVLCPWCGRTMQYKSWRDYDIARLQDMHEGWFECIGCMATSPTVKMDEKEFVCQAAYEAATRRPPNKPLTLPELFDLDPESDAVWIYDSSWEKPIRAMSAEEACEWASDADTVLFFASKPTAADIDAARKEQPHE